MTADSPAIRVVLFDLDGVIRHFSDAHRLAVVERYGLDDAELLATAFSAELGEPVITGRMTRADWVVAVGEAVGAPEAARDWLANVAEVDPEMVDLLDRIRAGGTTVALLTNGTDTIDAELAANGLCEHLDVVFNSAVIGIAKPDPRVYRHVADQLGVDTGQVWFTDDKAANVDGAVNVGMHGRVFDNVAQTKAELQELGLVGR